MGPTNVALVKLYKADQELRAAQARLDAASKDVRVQERRVNDLTEKHKLAVATHMTARSKAGEMESDLKARDAHIEKLRAQQQTVSNNREFQAFLVEINTEKLDKGKIEEELLKQMEQADKHGNEVKDLAAALENEKAKLATLKQQSNDNLKTLKDEIEALRPARDQAAAAVPQKALISFERLAEHHDGEAMSPITKPDKRREEYVCGACNMDLVVDVYNKLHSRDEMFFCPSCRRILYIPEDLPPETAVHKKKPTKSRKAPQIAAAPRRGEMAADVLNSVTPDEEDSSSATATNADAPSGEATTEGSSPEGSSAEGSSSDSSASVEQHQDAAS